MQAKTIKLTGVLLVLVAVLVSGCATVSTSGEYTLGSGETLRGDLVVTSGQATLEEGSRVTGSVTMTSGDLYVEADAEIGGDVVMTSGDLYLRPGAIVRGDVIRTSGEIHRAEGARIEGHITSNVGGYIAGRIFIRCCLPVLGLVVVVGALLFWIQRRRRPVVKAPAPQAQAPVAPEDPTQKLKQLKEMMDEGLISEAEYEAKKAEILSKM